MSFNIVNKKNNIFGDYLKYIVIGTLVITGLAYVSIFQLGGVGNIYLLLLATLFAIYMAVNLGANDVANNMGPAVGSKALTLTGAIIIAVIFEAGGALIAGGDVVDTIKGGIINPDLLDKNSMEFIAVMLSTLLGAALWVNIATILKAPVSITHAIFGGLIGAGITSAGFNVVNWGMVGKVAGAWVIAILMGGIVATTLFISIKETILKKENKGKAAKVFVPIYVSFMTGIFTIYLILKGFKNKLKGTELDFLLEKPTAVFIGAIIAGLTYLYLRISYSKHKKGFFRDKTKFVNTLFNIPLIVAVALLSFAHGANDVANAIGPLAAINESLKSLTVEGGKVNVPFWIMLLGALSLSVGLAVFGGRLIKTVGNEITKLDQIKAYCIALSAAITVILASAMGLPVSTTQIAIGGVFGIGLYREYLKRRKGKNKTIIDKSMIKGIIKSWVMTLPLAGIVASITYLIIMLIV
ncbi:hypothetical protein CSB08_00290 [Candidatus Gracilibacteria bacterium]|nr:MAG: hypothetical protein CSB08_00290 [Candidatus Gracilibacteria bacterium]PIE85281.1 MAG: hypothetical protein CSA08_02640 [Candidatus Gracilibacteria bacterium]